MDFIGGITLKEIGTAMINEGVGTAGGFIGGAMLGRQGENLIMGKDPITQVQIEVQTTDTLTTKAKAWAGNNVPKIAAWYLLRRYDAGSEVTKDVTKAVMGSVAFDTLLRLANQGVNGAAAYLGDYRILSGGAPAGNANVQRLMHENNVLKAELNKAVKLAAGAGNAGSGSAGIRVQEVPQAPSPPPYPLATTAPARQEYYGFMKGQGPVAQREKDFGFMDGNIRSTDRIAKMFNML